MGINSKVSKLLSTVPLWALLVTQVAVAQDQDVDAEKGSEGVKVGQLPYEVIVRPQITRRDLRQLIVQVEEDFYGRFNELNIDDYYDIHCYKNTPTMSHISERICEPWFAFEARHANAAETARLLGDLGPWGGGGHNNVYAMNKSLLKSDKKSDYELLQEKLEEFTRSDTEFRAIGNVLAALKKQLENFGEEQ